MDQRWLFVMEAQLGAEALSALCRKYGISRKTGYKWLKRYHELGKFGFMELTRRPRGCPHRTPVEMREAVVALRKAWPGIGPRKIAGELRNRGLRPPSHSTIALILKDAGLVKARRRRNARFRQWPDTLTEPEHPNHVWSVDYKGWFRMLCGSTCYPLTIMDSYSRFLVGCEALSRPAFAPTREAFDRTFARFGLPEIIRVDNGTPFAGAGAGGLSRLSALWLRLGIDVEFIEPGKPQQNGAHERMHRSLKREIRLGRGLRQQQRRFRAWRRHYNHNRPHEALGMAVPAQVYVRSERRYPAEIPDFQYAAQHTVRRVKNTGEIKWRGRRRYISQGLAGSLIGLLENRAGDLNIYAGSVLLGILPASGSGGLIRPPEPVDEQ
ncbi:IS481 family transposase [Desulfovibrio caledoniensis]